jgi:nucleoid-associated protein YgaU
MTRENKLALVIGFGLLMLAGILVSDHLSAQQRAEEEPLLAAVPDLALDLAVTPTTPLRAPNPALLQPRASDTQQSATPQPPASLVLGGSLNSAAQTPGRPAQTQRLANAKTHVLKAGETLSAIAQRYLGSANRWPEIARTNNLSDPSRVPIGTRLVISLAPVQTTRATTSPAQPTQRSTPRTITVRDGETLSDIAKRELGSAGKWQTIWKANVSTLPNPNKVSVGMVLKLPSA